MTNEEREKKRVYMQKWRLENKERAKELNKKHKEKRLSAISEYNKKYYIEHKEKINKKRKVSQDLIN